MAVLGTIVLFMGLYRKAIGSFGSRSSKRNRERDIENVEKLIRNGWKVIRIWEHTVRKNPEGAIAVVEILVSPLVLEAGWKAYRL